MSINGVHCAMSLNQPDAALTFLQVLTRDFPHVTRMSCIWPSMPIRILSTRAAQELAQNARSSYQAHELQRRSPGSTGKMGRGGQGISSGTAAESAPARHPFPSGTTAALQTQPWPDSSRGREKGDGPGNRD